MFEPQCRITPHLIGLFEKIASASILIKPADVKLSLRMILEADAVNRSVRSSTWIEGNTLSLKQVEALSAHRIVTAEENQKKEVENCLNALRWGMASRKKPLTQSRLLKLHAMMTKDLLPPQRCGKYRTIRNYIINARNQIIFTPPAPGQVKKRMAALLAWAGRSTEHGIVRAAVFHHEFVAVHPFTDGNGRTARAAQQWLLWEKGYEPLHTLGLDEFFATGRPRYYEMIRETHDMDGDYTHWVEYVAEGLLNAVERAAVRIKDASRFSNIQKIALTPKQEQLLKLLAGGPAASADIGARMNINRARVNQLIAPMVKAGIVIQRGATRGAQYSLA